MAHLHFLWVTGFSIVCGIVRVCVDLRESLLKITEGGWVAQRRKIPSQLYILLICNTLNLHKSTICFHLKHTGFLCFISHCNERFQDSSFIK